MLGIGCSARRYMASFRSANGAPSSLRLDCPSVPLADADLLPHCHILHYQLPALAAPCGGVDPATAQLATYMGQVVEEHCLTRGECGMSRCAGHASHPQTSLPLLGPSRGQPVVPHV